MYFKNSDLDYSFFLWDQIFWLLQSFFAYLNEKNVWLGGFINLDAFYKVYKKVNRYGFGCYRTDMNCLKLLVISVLYFIVIIVSSYSMPKLNLCYRII